MDKKTLRSRVHSLGRFTQLVMLVFFAGCLATHFVTENLETSISPGVFEPFEGGSHAQVDRDGCEDNFVPPLLARLSIDDLPLPPVSLSVARPAFPPIAILLPPPNS
jgi:hypothetical protein